jgi:hypothetical protein
VRKNVQEKVELVYQSTVQFDSWMGTINDVVPVSKDEFYVTNYLPFTEGIEGRPNDAFSKIMSLSYIFAQPLLKVCF